MTIKAVHLGSCAESRENCTKVGLFAKLWQVKNFAHTLKGYFWIRPIRKPGFLPAAFSKKSMSLMQQNIQQYSFHLKKFCNIIIIKLLLSKEGYPMYKKTEFINGNEARLVIGSDAALPSGLRGRLLFAGTKVKCGKGECGA